MYEFFQVAELYVYVAAIMVIALSLIFYFLVKSLEVVISCPCSLPCLSTSVFAFTSVPYSLKNSLSLAAKEEGLLV